MYDTIIIGAGMSGLAAGIRLAYCDQRVCILERHYTIGGLDSFYRLNGRDYDAGLHAVTNVTPRDTRKSPLEKLLQQLQFRWDEFSLAPQVGSTIAFPDVRLQFENDFECFESEVRRHFPGQQDNLRRLLAKVVDFDDLDQETYDLSTRAVLADTIDDPLLTEMLLCPLMWYGNARENDMHFGEFCVLFRSIFLEGLSRPFAGVPLILRNMVRKFCALGGELKLRSGVDRIVTDQRHVAGVVLDDGQQLEGRHVISSAGWQETMRMCQGRDDPLTDQQGQISFAETVAVLDNQPKQLGYDRTIVFFNDLESFSWKRPASLCDVRTGVVCSTNNYLYGQVEGQQQELFEGIIRVTVLANFDLWRQLGKDQHRVQKLRWYERVVDSAVRFVPDFRGHIIASDMFTPKTIRHFTWNHNGAAHGKPEQRIDGTTRLDNLFVCGTNQGFAGIFGAIMSGIMIANRHCLRGEDVLTSETVP